MGKHLINTSSLTINNQSGTNLYDDVVGPGFSDQPLQTGQSNVLWPGQNTIAIGAAPQMRIYISSSSSLFANPGQEPIGWNTTSPFSFYEYTIDGSGFYTASKDDYYGTFTVADISNVTLTIGPLTPPSTGTSNNDSIVGSGRNDSIVGSGRNDMISGGCGADWLAGAPLAANWSVPNNDRDLTLFAIPGAPLQWKGLIGGGRDTFVYVRADSRRAGLQPFRWIGARAFYGVAGQLRLEQNRWQNHTLLQGDIDGNGKSDFKVMLTGPVQFWRPT